MSSPNKISLENKTFINELCRSIGYSAKLIINELNKLPAEEITFYISELRNGHETKNTSKIKETLINLHDVYLRYRNRHHIGSAGAGGAGAGGASAVGASGASVFRFGRVATPPVDKRLFIMGHGAIINEEYTIIPDKLNMIFYTNRSVPLNIGMINKIFRNRKIYNSDHTLFEKSAMKNMIIDLRGFYVLGDYPHFITNIGYSGIITNNPYGILPPLFYDIHDDYFTNNGIEIITEHPIEIALNGQSNKNRFVIPFLYNQGVKNIKIIHFGNNIYGIIYDNNYYIQIINNIHLNIGDALANSIIRIIKKYYNIRNIPKGINVDEEKHRHPRYRMHTLSLIFNDDSIIDTLDIINLDYRYKLSEIFNKIIESNFYTDNNDLNIYSHNLVCRSDYTPLPETINETNEGSLLASTTLHTLQRQSSASNQYIHTFENILERYRNASKYINLFGRDEQIKNKVNQTYKRIIQFYNENKYITEEDMEFILELISMTELATTTSSNYNNRKISSLDVYKSTPNTNNKEPLHINTYWERPHMKIAQFEHAYKKLNKIYSTTNENSNGTKSEKLQHIIIRIMSKIDSEKELTFMDMQDMDKIIRLASQYRRQ